MIRTVRPDSGLVEVWVSPGSEAEFERLRLALASEGLEVGLAPGEAA